jgi:hypothetical protein
MNYIIEIPEKNLTLVLTDHKTKIVGYTDLGTVYPTDQEYQAFKARLAEHAAGREVGQILLYHRVGDVEWHCAPDIKAFWKENFA